ncbi:MAG: response regulator [Methylococcales bacterium]|nr:response regulator [Methylococcales bacterium]MBT7408656.1 response regulator [Methylococcales bacterium]
MNQQFTSSVIEQINIGLIGVDQNGQIILWNQWLEKYSHFTADDAINQRLLSIFPELKNSRIMMAVNDVINKGFPAVISNVFNRQPLPLFSNSSSTDRLYISINMIPVKMQDQSCCIIQINDLTASVKRENVLEQQVEERKKAEAVMEIAKQKAEESNRAKSDFLATMSHEIRTPMNGVLSATGLLMDDHCLSREQYKLIEVANQSGQNLMSIINDILDFSKIESGKMTLEAINFNLHKTILDAIDLMRPKLERRPVSLEIDYSVDCPEFFFADEGRIRQVILNLLSNAVKFTTEGFVRVSVRSEGHHDNEECIVISVRDSGIGMTKEQQSKLFQAFTQADSSTTRRFGGTGLGLAICKRIIELCQGDIQIDSVIDEGSDIWFKLNLPVTAVNQNHPTASIEKKSVLVLDEELSNAATLQKKLSELGMRVFRVSTIKDAIQFFSKDRPSIHLIIADFVKPEVSAEKFIKSIRAETALKDLPLIILTSVMMPGDIEKFQSLGYMAYLTKIEYQSILERVVSIVMGYAEQGEIPNEIINYLSLTGAEIPRLTKPIDLTGKVLLVDDLKVNRMLAGCILKKIGFDVDEAGNGEEAVEKWRNNKYNLILMDCQMPIMDGYDATKMIRLLEHTEKRSPAIPVIALTANAFEEDKQKCLLAGMNDVVTKPIEMDQLVKTIKHFLT